MDNNTRYVPNGQRVVRHWRGPGNKTLCGVNLSEKRRTPVLAVQTKYKVTCMKCLGLGRAKLPDEASLTASTVKLERLPLYITKLEIRATRAEESLRTALSRIRRAEYENATVHCFMYQICKMVDEWRAHEKVKREENGSITNIDHAGDLDGGGSSAVARQ